MLCSVFCMVCRSSVFYTIRFCLFSLLEYVIICPLYGMLLSVWYVIVCLLYDMLLSVSLYGMLLSVFFRVCCCMSSVRYVIVCLEYVINQFMNYVMHISCDCCDELRKFRRNYNAAQFNVNVAW